ncbi:MAG: hypothetical protein Q4E34_00390 [Synergistaceae bacterium]|nr:hypothetical protein [Synergistaceae bacterium]
MAVFKETELIKLTGSFGDRELRIEKAVPAKANGIQVVFLHGVFSSANLGSANKFRVLAGEMCKRGFTCWLTETSRNIHNRDDFEDQGEWVRLAFAGKAYAQELSDAMKMVREVIRRTKGQPLWLWGFSLGGISACCCAAEPDINVKRLIVAGTGLYPKKKAEYMFELPILNTLKQDADFDVMKKVRTDSFIAFRGQKDEIFPRKACEKLYDSIKTDRGRKLFCQLPYADHSIRCVNGVVKDRLMSEMAEIAAKFQEPED